MGASTFSAIASGATPNDAFRSAVEHAQFMHGHGGYTGTIAEKHSFTLLTPPAGMTPEDFVDKLLDEDDPRISDKWGPAGCVKLDDGRYLFFGWASD